MSGVLEIQSDPQETQAAPSPAEVSMQDLPDYLQVEGDESKTPIALSIVAVSFFLLTTVGLAAGAQYYLSPQRDLAQQSVDEKQAEIDSTKSSIEKEQRKSKVHLEMLTNVQKTLTSPERSRIADQVAELHSLAHDVALKHAASGGFVTLQTINIGEDGSASIGGAVDSYLTLADWLQALQTSPFFEQVKFNSASSTGDEASPSVPFNFSFRTSAGAKQTFTIGSKRSGATGSLVAPGGDLSVPPSGAPVSLPPSGAPASSAPPSVVAPRPLASPPSSASAPVTASDIPLSAPPPSAPPSSTPPSSSPPNA